MASKFLYLIIWIIIGCLNVDKCVKSKKISNELNIGARFVEEPKDTVTKKKNSVIFDCTIRKNNNETSYNFIYTWLKDGQKLNSSNHLQVLRNGSLLIKRVRKGKQRNDEGEYQCLVQINKLGYLISTSASLRVAYLNRFVEEEPKNVTAYKGGVALFRCRIEGWPVPSIHWTRNGKPLPQENRYVTFASGYLEISNPTLSDEGSYRCVASNMAKNRTSQRAYLKVIRRAEKKLKVLATPKNVTVNVGEDAEFACAAYGKPQPDIQWQAADGSSVMSNPRSAFYGKNNLVIHNVETYDAGKYICMISWKNEAPELYYAILTVLERPVLTHLFQKQYEYPSARTMRVYCQFRGQPQPQVTWTKNGQVIIQDNHMEYSENVPFNQTHSPNKDSPGRNMLKISHSVESDTGIYQCFGKNIAGQAQGAVRITVKHSVNAPDPPVDVSATVLSQSEVMLTWKLPKSRAKLVAFSAHYFPTIGLTTELQKVVSGNKTSMIIETLKPYTSYKFFMVAYNSDGASQKSRYLSVTTGESYPIAVPEVTATSVDSNSLLIKWEHLPAIEARGAIKIYHIYLRKHHSDIVKSKEVYGNTTEYLWEKLEQGEKYDVRVEGGTSVGFPRISLEDIVWYTSKTNDIENLIFKVEVENSTTVFVSWNRGNLQQVHEMSAVVHYNLSCSLVESDEIQSTTLLSASAQNITVHNLDPDTHYQFTLAVFYEDGYNTSVSDKLWMPPYLDRYPPPTSIVATAKSANEIYVSWKPVTWEGCEVHYVVQYAPQENVNSKRQVKPKEVPRAVSPTILKDLKPYTEYQIQIFSQCEDKKKGSRMQMEKTDESLPSEPEGLVVFQAQEANSIHLMWKEPKQCNGIIRKYEVYYTEKEDLDSIQQWLRKVENETSRETVIQNLKSEQWYFFKMCAVTSIGKGKFTEMKRVKTSLLPMRKSSLESDGGRLGIILGVVIGGGCIFMCLLVLLCIFCRPCKLCRHSGRSRRLPDNSSSHQGNGFGPNGNHLVTSRDIDSDKPMLYENHIDSKGGKSPPVSRGPCNGYATRTHYMPNGNVRTILAESNKPQETSFGPDNSQVPLTSICESLETADTGYSEPREFDPDTLDSSDDEVEVNNTSILLPADKGSSQDNLQLGSGPLNCGKPSPHTSLIIKNSSSNNNKQNHVQPQSELCSSNSSRIMGDDCNDVNCGEKNSCNDGDYNKGTNGGRCMDSLTPQEKLLLSDNHHHQYHLFNSNSNHPSALTTGVPFPSLQKNPYQGMQQQQEEDDLNECSMNHTGEKDESDDDYVKLAVAAPNQNTSVSGEQAHIIIKKQPTSGLLPSASAPNPLSTPSSTENPYDCEAICNREDGSRGKVTLKSSSPITTQQVTSKGNVDSDDDPSTNILLKNSSADNNKFDTTPRQPHCDLKEVSSPPLNSFWINPPLGQEHGNGYKGDPDQSNPCILDKNSGQEQNGHKNGFVMNGNCLNGVKYDHQSIGTALGISNGANGVLSGVDIDSSCGNEPILNGHVAALHQDDATKGNKPRVNVNSAYGGQASLNVIA